MFNKTFYYYFILSSFIFLACENKKENRKTEQQEAAIKNITKIAFGSCIAENHPLPIFNNIVSHKPDLFIFLGDNIYGDTKNSERRKHEGIYQAYIYEYDTKKVQVILLDERTFRDELLSNKTHPYQDSTANNLKYSFYDKTYAPHTDSTKTLLGHTQWKWLENELRKPADVRIIGSSIQFGIEWNGWEAWANFPHEQERLIRMIEDTKANGVMIISGDVHYSEL